MAGPAAQRPPFNRIEAARQQNLAKIQHLQQTLEAAQQQEIQYKSQLEVCMFDVNNTQLTSIGL
jgi:mediator of RNA polymerase II transcription subunit 25